MFNCYFQEKIQKTGNNPKKKYKKSSPFKGMLVQIISRLGWDTEAQIPSHFRATVMTSLEKTESSLAIMTSKLPSEIHRGLPTSCSYEYFHGCIFSGFHSFIHY